MAAHRQRLPFWTALGLLLLPWACDRPPSAPWELAPADPQALRLLARSGDHGRARTLFRELLDSTTDPEIQKIVQLELLLIDFRDRRAQPKDLRAEDVLPLLSGLEDWMELLHHVSREWDLKPLGFELLEAQPWSELAASHERSRPWVEVYRRSIQAPPDWPKSL